MPLSDKIEIRKAGIHGFSWFAKDDIKAGEWLWKVREAGKPNTDVKLTIQQVNAMPKEKREKFMALAYQIDPQHYLGFDPEKEPIQSELNENYVNHCCDGNAWYENDDLLVAMRDIKKGEEVCYDYALTEGNDDWILAEKCLCGAKACRVKVTGLDWMKPELQSKYGKHFLSYIMEKINKHKAKQANACKDCECGSNGCGSSTGVETKQKGDNAPTDCCGGGCCKSEDSTEEMKGDAKSVHEAVADYYGKRLQSTKDLKSSACCTAGKPHAIIRQHLSKVPSPILERYYGCGNPIPFGITGLHVLDLGSGSGRDCYIAAAMVGPTGLVTGIDMTDEQLKLAREHVDSYTSKTLGYPKPNLQFVKGYIELLKEAGIKNESMDLVISNCVVNLSPDKRAVIQGVYNALKEGGEFFFSDVYCDRRLPDKVRNDKVLYGECLGGALYLQDFYRICRSVGFTDPRILSRSPIEVQNEVLQNALGNAKFQSITFRLFKQKNLETLCEDYGQVAVYKGTIQGHSHNYPLDDHHTFITGKPMLVCGNTASMVGESWLKPHFTITGDRSVHYGLFDCSSPTPAKQSSSGSGNCAGGACC